jgi:hypothetical protein
MYSGPYPCVGGAWLCPDGWYEACEPFPNEYCYHGGVPDAGTDAGAQADSGQETDGGGCSGEKPCCCRDDMFYSGPYVCNGSAWACPDGWFEACDSIPNQYCNYGGLVDAGSDAGGGADGGPPADAGACVQDCAGKQCGDANGCGGKCAACPDPSEGCNTATWQCEACSRNCGANGRCVFRNGAESCRCDPGYHIQGAACVSDAGTPCEGVTCSGRGTCEVRPFIGNAECVCDSGYSSWGRSCADERWIGCRDQNGQFATRGTSRCDATDTFLETCRDADGDGLSEWAFGADCVSKPCSQNCLNRGCDVQPCPLGTSCVTEAHGEPLFACVVTCDCSNCGNCDMEDFAQSGAMQAQCGNPDGPAPTTACRLPCPYAGHGCIPYSPPICWGLEGCMSAAPAGP